MTSITSIDMMAMATSLPYCSSIASFAASANDSLNFLSYDSSFTNSILAPGAPYHLISTEPTMAFHESGVYHHATNSVYISSSYSTENYPSAMTVYNLTSDEVYSTHFPDLYEANGGTAYTPPSPSNASLTTPSYPPYLLLCDAGTLTHPSALKLLNPTQNTTTPLLTSFYGRPFASLNDIRQHPRTGELFLTDNSYGAIEAYRSTPTIPSQVYRFNPSTGAVFVVASGFVEPNGFEFSPDLKTAYITDTGEELSTTAVNRTRPAAIYAFDLSTDGATLSNRRVFAYSDAGIPDGVHTDDAGNVWAACADAFGRGLSVWSREGRLVGKISVGEGQGVNAFVFVPGGVMVFAQERLWWVGLRVRGREVARDFYGRGSA
ncbi:lactonohydrolase, partial [Aulographum hederae CBS 113979]